MTDTKQRTKKPAARKKAPPTATLLPTVETMAVAEAMGFPRAFLRRAKKAGCPAFRLGNRIDLNELVPWIFSDASDDAVDWGKELTKAKAEREQLRLAKDRGEAGDRGEMADALRQAFAIYDAEHERAFTTIQPPKCQGLTAPEVAELNKSLIIKAREAAMEILKHV